MKAADIQPYLFFNGRCEEALGFYKGALGSKVMHANSCIGETQIMAMNGRDNGEPGFQGFALTLNVFSVADADRFFQHYPEQNGADAACQNIFFSIFRHNCRPLHCAVDDSNCSR